MLHFMLLWPPHFDPKQAMADDTQNDIGGEPSIPIRCGYHITQRKFYLSEERAGEVIAKTPLKGAKDARRQLGV